MCCDIDAARGGGARAAGRGAEGRGARGLGLGRGINVAVTSSLAVVPCHRPRTTTATATATRPDIDMNGTSQPRGDSGGGFENQIDSLLQLVTARARGEVGNEEVEGAISQLLEQQQPPPPTGTTATTANNLAPATASARVSEKAVIEDDDDYDDPGDDASHPKPSAGGGSRGTKRRRSGSSSSGNDDDNSGRGGDDGSENEIDQSKQWDELDAIPLGRQGAKMMVTFGDGRNPRPKTVEAALLGARRLIQYAVRDARALRRKHKAEYKKAQAAATLHGTRPKHIDQKTVDSVIAGETTVDSSMLFRAIGGYDRLSYDPKCGFDVPELEVLFPEEMMAYQRWKRMQKAYAQSKEDRGDGDAMDGDDNEDNEDGNVGDDDKVDTSDNNKKKDDDEDAMGGHLNRRLQQFDARTEQMKEKWYLSFSEVRQGSFIDKATGVDGRLWRQAQKKAKKGKGRNKSVTWESLPAGCVTFLHWVGFDLTSSIPPPNEATANALAFLAYDFMGKIVEKAIFLRRLAQREEIRAKRGKGNRKGENINDVDDGDDFLLELKGNDQLTVEEIGRALNDSTVVSEPLYGAANSSLGGTGGSKPQLYFGPGFEERLEMEMEEFVQKKNKSKIDVSEEEQKIRDDEDEIFSKMDKPPTRLDGVMDVLGEDITDEMREKREVSKAMQKSHQMRKDAEMDPTKMTKKKRGRGRPRKYAK